MAKMARKERRKRRSEKYSLKLVILVDEFKLNLFENKSLMFILYICS